MDPQNRPPLPTPVDVAQASNPAVPNVDALIAQADALAGDSSFSEGLAKRRSRLAQLTGATQSVEQFQQSPGFQQNLTAIESDRAFGERPSDLLRAAIGVESTSRGILSEAAQRETAGLNSLDNFLNTALGFVKQSRQEEQEMKDRALDRQIKQVQLQRELAETGLLMDANGDIRLNPAGLPKDTAEMIKSTDNLRDEFLGQEGIKNFATIKAQFDKIQSASETAAGDLALIFGLMKMFDPTSVVREGEFANAQNATGVPDRLKNQYNRIISGSRLNSKQRGEFKSEAASQFNANIRTAQQRASFYAELAAERGLDPDDVVGVLGPLEEVVIESIISEKDIDTRERKTGIFAGFIDKLLGRESKPPLSSFEE